MHLTGSFPVFLYTHEDPNTTRIFHRDKSDDALLSSITINSSIVFENLASIKTGKSPGLTSRGFQMVCRSVMYVSLCLYFLSN